MINFEEEIERFKPSLEVEAVSDAIVKSDLTDMADIMMDIMKDIKRKSNIWMRCRRSSTRPTATTTAVWKWQRRETFPGRRDS
ncbi:MAG: hypothetical protein ACLUAR_17290 [Pilosibacter sp.]